MYSVNIIHHHYLNKLKFSLSYILRCIQTLNSKLNITLFKVVKEYSQLRGKLTPLTLN